MAIEYKDNDIVVWGEKQWCYWKDFSSFGRNRSLNYQVLVAGTQTYEEFLKQAA